MSARDRILGRLHGALGQSGRAPGVEARLREHRRNVVPDRATLDPAACRDLFVAMAEEAAATVRRVRSDAEVPGALAEYLAQQNLPARVAMAPDPALDPIPWDAAELLEIRRGRAEPTDEVGVTGAFAAIAETGTLMTVSGEAHPTTLNFLPETHVVVLRADAVVGPIEDAWDRLRDRFGEGMPRTVNFVTGPSRSADIEQQLQMGAHGPRRLHIILVDDGPA